MSAMENSSSDDAAQRSNSQASSNAAHSLEQLRREAAQNSDAMYKQFDTYPWAKDPKFQQLLAQDLFHPQTDGTPAEIALKCRTKIYKERVGIEIDPDQYNTYRSTGNFPDAKLVDESVLEQERLHVPNAQKRRFAMAQSNNTPISGSTSTDTPDTNDQNIPSWQLSAPKAELYIDKTAVAQGMDKEPYPKKFEEIIAFIQSGQEIPGIKKIPDTVIDNPVISTTGRPAPPKPWEKAAAQVTDEVPK